MLRKEQVTLEQKIQELQQLILLENQKLTDIHNQIKVVASKLLLPVQKGVFQAYKDDLQDYQETFDVKELEEIKKLYLEDEENNKVSVISAEIEAEFYCRYTRVEEIIEFSKRMGFHKIGIATCIGLIEESRIFAQILRKNGFEPYAALCKAGAFNKTDIGVRKEYTTQVGNALCNPIMQAKLLEKAGTDFNVVVGLCVGHDSLFYKYTHTLTTTLVTKDRVLAHNPVGALYQTKAYYKKLMADPASGEKEQ